MRRLNTNITEEAFDLLREEADRLGTSIGTIITMLCLNKKKENDELKKIDLYKKVQEGMNPVADLSGEGRVSGGDPE